MPSYPPSRQVNIAWGTFLYQTIDNCPQGIADKFKYICIVVGKAGVYTVVHENNDIQHMEGWN